MNHGKRHLKVDGLTASWRGPKGDWFGTVSNNSLGSTRRGSGASLSDCRVFRAERVSLQVIIRVMCSARCLSSVDV